VLHGGNLAPRFALIDTLATTLYNAQNIAKPAIFVASLLYPAHST